MRVAALAFGVLAGLALSPFSRIVRLAFGAVMLLYFALAILAGIQQAMRYREPLHVIFAPIGFFLFHFPDCVQRFMKCVEDT